MEKSADDILKEATAEYVEREAKKKAKAEKKEKLVAEAQERMKEEAEQRGAPSLDSFLRVFVKHLSPAEREVFEASDKSPQTIWDTALRTHMRITHPEVFYIRRGDKEIISRNTFDEMFTPIVNQLAIPTKYKDKPSKLAKASLGLEYADRAVYRPEESDVIGSDFNMWNDPHIEPLAERPDVFLDHVHYLFPDPRDRRLFMCYLAWMVQRYGQKMTFALIIVGRKRTGKSLLALLFTSLFGQANVLVLPKGEKITDRFNAEQANKRVVFIDELVPDEKTNLWRAVVPMIVGRDVWIERKGIDKIRLDNLFNCVAITNYMNTLKIDRDEGKALVLQANDQMFGAGGFRQLTLHGSKLTTTEYYERLFAAITPADTVPAEIRRVLWWMRQYKMAGNFNGQGLAPQTETRTEIAEAAETALASRIHDGVASKTGVFGQELFTVQQVRGEVAIYDADAISAKKLDAEIATYLQDAGCAKAHTGQIEISGQRLRLWTTRDNLARFAGMAHEKLREIYLEGR